ncbi:MAG: nitroreductase family protein [archaeon]|nr:nitroreductase family protein [archaeon]
MELLEEIDNRRSCRSLRDHRFTDEEVTLLLRAACAAPSSKNRQAWKIMPACGRDLGLLADVFERAVDDRHSRGLLSDGEHAGCVSTARIMREAPLGLIVFTDPVGTVESRQQSVGAMMESMCLQAEHMGLSTLWVCDILDAREECEGLLHQEGLSAMLLVGEGKDDGRRAMHKEPGEVIVDFPGEHRLERFEKNE